MFSVTLLYGSEVITSAEGGDRPCPSGGKELGEAEQARASESDGSPCNQRRSCERCVADPLAMAAHGSRSRVAGQHAKPRSPLRARAAICHAIRKALMAL